MLKSEAFLTVIIAVVIIFIVSAYGLRSDEIVQHGAADQLQKLAANGKIAISGDGGEVKQVAPLTPSELNLVTKVQQKLGQLRDSTTDSLPNVADQLYDMLKPVEETTEVTPQVAETVLDRLVSQGKVNINTEEQQVEKTGQLTEAEENVVNVFNRKMDDISGKSRLPVGQNPAEEMSEVDQMSLQQIAAALADMKRKVLVEVDPKKRDIRLVLSKQELTPFQQQVVDRAQEIMRANREAEKKRKAAKEAATAKAVDNSHIDRLADRVTGRILRAVEKQQMLLQEQQKSRECPRPQTVKSPSQCCQQTPAQCGRNKREEREPKREDCGPSWYKASSELARRLKRLD